MGEDLTRFEDAQRTAYAGALRELQAGRKRGHWIWFVLPQLAGLGRSPMAVRYGIRDETEARAYLAHPVLGPRLLECLDAVLAADGDAETIMGSDIDVMKLRSSVTLFAHVCDEPAAREVLHRVLTRFFAGEPDEHTVNLLTG